MICFLCRSYANQQNPLDNYPQAFIEQLHNGDINSSSMFSPSFVDHMRIPRAMEVKIVQSVNSLNKTHPQPPYSPPRHLSIPENDYLDTNMFSLPTERRPPSRQQSFRYQNMSTEESKERIYREKLLVSELREKLRNQKRIDEWRKKPLKSQTGKLTWSDTVAWSITRESAKLTKRNWKWRIKRKNFHRDNWDVRIIWRTWTDSKMRSLVGKDERFREKNLQPRIKGETESTDE